MKKIFTLLAAALLCTATLHATVTLTQQDGTPVTDNGTLFFDQCEPELQAAGFLQIIGHLKMTTDADVKAVVKLESLSGDPVIDFCVNDQCIPADKVVTKNVNMVVGRNYALDFHLGGVPHLATEKLTAESRLTVTAGSQTISVTIKMSNDPAGVNDIAADNFATAQYYDLQGRPVTSPAAGNLYIMRHSDGTVSKTVCR